MFPVSKRFRARTAALQLLDWRAFAGLTILALALSASGPVAAGNSVVLDPVPGDEALSGFLDSTFTLPMLMGIGGQLQSEMDEEIAAEVTKLAGALHSRGYLDAEIVVTGSGTPDDPLHLLPVPGELYQIGAILIDGVPRDAGAALTVLGNLATESQHKPATREVIDQLSARIVYALREVSYADAEIADIDFVRDPQSSTVGLGVTLAAGPFYRFGEVAFGGQHRASEADLMAMVPFHAGQPYNIAAVDELWSALDETERFRRIRIEYHADPQAADVLDVVVNLWDAPGASDDLVWQLSDSGPLRLVFAMVLLLLIEALRASTVWSDRHARSFVLIPTVVLVGGSVLVIAERFYSFL